MAGLTVQTLLDGVAASAALLDPSGRITMVNRSWTQFCVANGGRLSAVTAPADYLAACAGATPASSARDVVDGITAVLTATSPQFDFEYPCHGPDVERWFRMTVTPVPDGVLVIHSDITGEYERVSRWLAATPTVIVELDAQRHATFVNASWARLAGRPARRLLGSAWASHLADDERSALLRAVNDAVTARSDVGVDVPLPGRQTQLWLRVAITPDFDHRGTLRRVTLVGLDVTAARQLATERAAARERREIAADKHDIVVQDLYAVGVALDLAQRKLGIKTDEIASARAGLDRATATLISLTNAGPDGPLPLSAAVAARLELARQVLGYAPGVAIEVDLDALSAATGRALTAVLSEALANVAHHAHATDCSVSISADGYDVVLTVTDNGTGMPAAGTGRSGIRSISERAAALGGSAIWGTSDDGGTTLEWRVPLPRV